MISVDPQNIVVQFMKTHFLFFFLIMVLAVFHQLSCQEETSHIFHVRAF